MSVYSIRNIFENTYMVECVGCGLCKIEVTLGECKTVYKCDRCESIDSKIWSIW